jgi:periplasmic protein TonB
MGGGDDKQRGGGGGVNGGGGSGIEQILPLREVEQRARLLLKPEPQYTEEARRNQITGTVMLRVVFSSVGSVEQIRALHTLPFGLTEKAIAAARQIKFVPAMKGGRPVSVYMQLEYNFNLY